MKRMAVFLLAPSLAFATITPHNATRIINNGHLTQPEWSAAINGISSGDNEWLAVAPLLASVADQRQAEQLSAAIYYALEPNAVGALKTLSILDKGQYQYQQGTDISCIPPFDKIEAEKIKTYEGIRLSLLDAGPQAAKCLWIMEGWVEEIKAEIARKP